MPADPAETPSVPAIRLMLTMWANIGLWQIDRLDEAADRYREAESAGLFREAFDTRGRPEEWRPTYEESRATITVAEYWEMGAERYFLLHALAQVRKCIIALPDDGLPAVRDMKVLRLLRDIDEHWEQLDGRSLREMREAKPNVQPGMVWLNNKHIWIGDLDTGELASWLASVDRVVRERAAADGSPLPSPEVPVQFRSSEDRE
jgi:hypothetical protein